MGRDDLYKSGTIYTGPGEPPNSQSRPTPRPKQVAGKPITKGKLLRPGGPGGGPFKLASRPATSRPVPQAIPQAAPSATLPTQSRPFPQAHTSTQRAVPQPLAAINGISHGRSKSASSTERSLPPPPPPAAPPAARKATYRALYDFVGQNANELSIRKNDIIEVMQKEGNGKLSPVPSLLPPFSNHHHHHPLTSFPPKQAGGSPRNKTAPPKAGPHPPTSKKPSRNRSTRPPRLPQSATSHLRHPAPTASRPTAPALSHAPPRERNPRLPPRRRRDRRRRQARNHCRRPRRGIVLLAWARRMGVRRVGVRVGGIRRVRRGM